MSLPVLRYPVQYQELLSGPPAISGLPKIWAPSGSSRPPSSTHRARAVQPGRAISKSGPEQPTNWSAHHFPRSPRLRVAHPIPPPFVSTTRLRSSLPIHRVSRRTGSVPDHREASSPAAHRATAHANPARAQHLRRPAELPLSAHIHRFESAFPPHPDPSACSNHHRARIKLWSVSPPNPTAIWGDKATTRYNFPHFGFWIICE